MKQVKAWILVCGKSFRPVVEFNSAIWIGRAVSDEARAESNIGLMEKHFGDMVEVLNLSIEDVAAGVTIN